MDNSEGKEHLHQSYGEESSLRVLLMEVFTRKLSVITEQLSDNGEGFGARSTILVPYERWRERAAQRVVKH